LYAPHLGRVCGIDPVGGLLEEQADEVGGGFEDGGTDEQFELLHRLARGGARRSEPSGPRSRLAGRGGTGCLFLGNREAVLAGMLDGQIDEGLGQGFEVRRLSMAAWRAGASSWETRWLRLAPSVQTWCLK
jgi:hypothetical protein